MFIYSNTYIMDLICVRHLLWVSGVVILITVVVEFLGYVLPWGQMSFGGLLLLQTYFQLYQFWVN